MKLPALLSASMSATLLALSACAAMVHAEPAPGPQGSTHMSQASNVVADGSARIVGGSLESVAGAGSLVVASVETAGDGSVVLLKAAGNASAATVALSGRAARDASLVVGASVEMVALSTGYLLVTAGRVLAFVPNEAGRALLHSRRLPATPATAS